MIVAVGDALHRRRLSVNGEPSAGAPDPEVEVLDRLVQESDKARADRGGGDASLSFVDMAARNAARFLGDHSTTFSGSSTQNVLKQEGFRVPSEQGSSDTGVIKAVLNRTQTSTLATHAAMTERPIQVAVDPVESDDRWQYVIKQRAVRRLALFMQSPAFVAQINPNAPLGKPQLTGFTSQELSGEAFIDDARAEWLMQTLRNPNTGEPLFDDTDFHIVNDVTTARYGKRLFINRWTESDGDAAVREHAFYMRVFGFAPVFFQFDAYGQCFWIENPHGLSVHPDPTHTRIKQFDYLVWDYHLTLDKAQAMYPRLKEKLKLAASEGKLKTDATQMPSVYGQDHDFERAMVMVRTGWIKNARVAMTEEEALQQEAVVLHEGPTGTSYVRKDTGQTVEPPTTEKPQGVGGWPKTFGILQVQVLPQIGKTIDKRRCPYITEPMGWTVNIPTFHKPWGIGDPYRLEAIQQAINRELTVLTTRSRYDAYPAEFWPADLWEDLRSRGFKLHIRPGRVIPVPKRMYDQMMQKGGRFGMTQEPPALPRDRVSLLQVLLGEHDRMSGHVEALQGRTPGAQTSGRTLQQLRQEARGPLGIQARNLEDTFTRIARLAMDSMVKWLRRPIAYEILNSIPPFVVDEVMRRLSLGRYNVIVSATMGRGILQQIDREESQQLFGLGVMDRATLLEDHGRDPGTILRRRRQDLEEDAAAQGVMEVQAQTRALGQQQQGVSAPGGTPQDGSPPGLPQQPAAAGATVG